MFCASESSRPSPLLSLRVGRGLRRESFSASADRPAGILVETGNSVDYSLAIRLLSLQWLSLLHHEIAWLSVRLESVLCPKPPPPPNACSLLHDSPPPHPFLSSPPQGRKKKRVHPAPLRSARQCRSKTGWLAVQYLLPHFLWPLRYPLFLFLAQKFILRWQSIVYGPYDLIVFRVNLEWQNQPNPIVMLERVLAGKEEVLLHTKHTVENS